MKIINDVLIAEEINDSLFFCCNLKICKGCCCVEGDAGAPIEEKEIELIQDNLEEIKPFMQDDAAKIINVDNLFDYDQDGNLVTTLLNDRECIFTNFDKDGIAFCAIEKAFLQNKIEIRKPISCYLYPLRINKDGAFEKIAYHKWNICASAIRNGNDKKIKLIDFLKEPLIQKFGKDWYKMFYNIVKGKQR